MYTIDKVQKHLDQNYSCQYVHIYWTATTCDNPISIPLDFFSGKTKNITLISAYMTSMPYLLTYMAPAGSTSVNLAVNSIIVNWDGSGTLVNTTDDDTNVSVSTEFINVPVKKAFTLTDTSIVDDALTTWADPVEVANPAFFYNFPIDSNKASVKFWIKYQNGRLISTSLNTSSYKSDINWQFHLKLLISN